MIERRSRNAAVFSSVLPDEARAAVLDEAIRLHPSARRVTIRGRKGKTEVIVHGVGLALSEADHAALNAAEARTRGR